MNTISTKWERDKCPHGKFRWVRWTYPDYSTVEDSVPEYSSCSCKLCNEGE
jgi:hypothetical protein